jgi:transposase-like protein
MTVSKRRAKTKAAERNHWAQRYYESGLTQREFGAQHGLQLSTLQRWVAQNPQRRTRGDASATPFCKRHSPENS